VFPEPNTVHYRLGGIGGAGLLAEFPRHLIERVLTERIKDRPCLRTIAHKLSMILAGSLREGVSLLATRARVQHHQTGFRGREHEPVVGSLADGVQKRSKYLGDFCSTCSVMEESSGHRSAAVWIPKTRGDGTNPLVRIVLTDSGIREHEIDGRDSRRDNAKPIIRLMVCSVSYSELKVRVLRTNMITNKSR